MGYKTGDKVYQSEFILSQHTTIHNYSCINTMKVQIIYTSV